MSKTKEEILQHHYIHDRGLVNPVLYVHNSMDEYAAQCVNDFKEKLRVKIIDKGNLTASQAIILIESL